MYFKKKILAHHLKLKNGVGGRETNHVLCFWWGHLNLESFTYQNAAIWQILNKKNNGSDNIGRKLSWKAVFQKVSKWLSVLVLARSI